ncbi:angiopoietin-like protein 8 isoform X1 [Camelus ferus]|uniref:Angiopoietin-like protein 8 isoform X1 n=2 Tax=Camelus TaxID=9836 RepID=T0NRY1_CAMFR|nr:angiopoietin-like protein 8 isoform X1 [Camelus ferus]XP_010965172.1 angiopoietin-like protein 8 isoform X1 [Camelus bactrianus]EQB78282.1 betatrophin precursor [Camelus ferus]
MPVLMLSLLCTLATVARPAPVASMSSSEPAQHEELTLLFHGALQLSQALNGVYKTTEAQLTEAGDSLGLYGQALGLLGQEVSQGQDAAQELRASLLEMQMEEDTLKLQSEATAQALGEAAQGLRVLRESVTRLEVQLRGAWLGLARQEFEALKAHADKQSHIVWALRGHVQRQRQEMVAQQQRLRQIQERLHMAALPA